MNNDLISRSELKEAINTYDTFACLPDGKLYPVRDLEHPELFYNYIHVENVIKAIDNAPSVQERPQGEWVEKYEKILQIVEHWNDKSSSFVSACEAFEKILDVTKGGAE